MYIAHRSHLESPRLSPFTLMQNIDSFVELLQREAMRYKLVDLNFAAFIILDKLWQAVATLPAAKSGALKRQINVDL